MMIRNIIFDFGGVIINIDPQSVIRELDKKGHDNLLQLHQYLSGKKAYRGLETGAITPEAFRGMVRSQLSKPILDEEIDLAWNAIIKDIPRKRIDMLEQARKNYNIFLLSNTNPIHYDHYNQYLRTRFGYARLDDLFHGAYYSFRLRMYKPDPGIYEHVISDAGLIPQESLFIDDNRENARAAVAAGMKGFHLEDGIDVTELFSEGRLMDRYTDGNIETASR